MASEWLDELKTAFRELLILMQAAPGVQAESLKENVSNSERGQKWGAVILTTLPNLSIE
ncbi:MAG: hypothetical protein VX328_04800 [Candidatus Thermoplasmatota archaeon]|nr:hypothetical protein [Candidatus Thermoplasmatota archaeon]